MGRVIVRGGWVFTGESVYSPGTVVIDGDRITRVAGGGSQLESMDAVAGRDQRVAPAPREELDALPGAREGDLVIDAANRLVTPGLINAHTHIYSALARGISLKDAAPQNFLQILERLWWRLDRNLTLADLDLSARLHGVECLRGGVTTVFDHHASPGAARGSLETIAGALGELGLRSCLGYEVSDRDGPEVAAAGIEENRAFLAGPAQDRSALVRGLFGLHASFTLGDGTLRRCAEAAGEAGFHLHLGEDRCDAEVTRERFGCTPTERLQRHGLLRRRTLCAHGVHLTDEDTAILAGAGATLVHCPESNMNNAVGVADLARLRDAGVRLALGTDGFTASMARTALAAQLLQSHRAGDPRAGYAVAPGLLFGGNRVLARETFGRDLGRLGAGAPADLVIWDYRPPAPLAAENIWGHLAFGLVTARAEEVFVAGRRVLAAGRPPSVDEDELAARCRDAAAALWERL